MTILIISVAGFALLAFSVMFINEVARWNNRHPPKE